MKGAVLATLLLLTVPAGAKTLIVGANGHAARLDGQVERFSGLLIDDDGRVETVLRQGDKEPKLQKGDFRLDVKGKALIPGFVDAHLQLMDLGLALGQADLSGARSVSEILDIIGKRPLAPDRWIRGHGWDERNWGSDAFPDAAMLDDGTGARPAFLVRSGGHIGWANSAALRAAGIDRNSKDPAGGQIVRDERGQPTGILVGSAMELVTRHAPAPTAREREKALSAALRHLTERGVTSVHDMGTTVADWALYRAFGDDGRLTLRINGYADGLAVVEALSPMRPTGWLYDGRLRLRGIHLDADAMLNATGAGYPAGGSAARLSENANEARLKNLISRVNFLGYQAAVRTVGTSAAGQLLDAYAEIVPAYGKDFRNRVEHADIAGRDVARFARLGLVASVQPLHLTREIFPAGQDRGAANLDQLRAAGIRVAFGSAAPWSPDDRFRMWRSVPQPATMALAEMTILPAYAGHAERDVGSLTPGQYADFLLLDRDPFANGQDEPIEVLETWVGGVRVFAADGDQPSATRKR